MRQYCGSLAILWLIIRLLLWPRCFHCIVLVVRNNTGSSHLEQLNAKPGRSIFASSYLWAGTHTASSTCAFSSHVASLGWQMGWPHLSVNV